MAFVRSKNIKGNEYLYLVKSVRNGDSVRQKVLEYLGPKGKVGLESVPVEYRDQVEEEELGTTTEGSYLEKTYEVDSKQDFREATKKLVMEALSDFGLEERPSEIQLTCVKTYHARFVSSSEDSFHKLRVIGGFIKSIYFSFPNFMNILFVFSFSNLPVDL
ncbi:hypothetical protein C9439_02140 [archaeon SCG-AAA382B04]|nr:hypothetical protein C9439_02140 [archaeon SCG-AAA382B04]